MKISDITIERPVPIKRFYQTNEAIFVFNSYVWFMEHNGYHGGKNFKRFDEVENVRKYIGLDKRDFDMMFMEESQDILEQIQDQKPNIQNVLVADL